MAITTLDQLIAAPSQKISYTKTNTVTTVAAIPFSVFDRNGNPGAGTLAIGNTANGVVPTDATAGYPTINAFGVGNTGYINSVTFGSTVACRITIFDCLFSAGAYAFNANTTLASQPSYTSRVLGGTDFSNTEIWIEAVTAFTETKVLLLPIQIKVELLDELLEQLPLVSHQQLIECYNCHYKLVILAYKKLNLL